MKRSERKLLTDLESGNPDRVAEALHRVGKECPNADAVVLHRIRTLAQVEEYAEDALWALGLVGDPLFVSKAMKIAQDRSASFLLRFRACSYLGRIATRYPERTTEIVALLARRALDQSEAEEIRAAAYAEVCVATGRWSGPELARFASGPETLERADPDWEWLDTLKNTGGVE